MERTARPGDLTPPSEPRRGFTLAQYLICLKGIVWREGLRFLHQRGRFVSALVRPLVWLLIFAAGFRSVLGVSIIPPYQTYVLYEEYITPGLMAMIQLFNGMQSSLSMVYDREMGNMRILLVSPLPRWFILVSKLLAGMMLGSLGMLLSSMIKQLENFAGVMNFVIFPMFFASSALYPLWRVQETSPVLYWICKLNPFTYAVELIRFALYCQLDLTSLLVTFGCMLLFLALALIAYDPSKGLIGRRGAA